MSLAVCDFAQSRSNRLIRGVPRAPTPLEQCSKSARVRGRRAFGLQVASLSRRLLSLPQGRAATMPRFGFLGKKEDAMTWIALKMLMGDRSKYFAIIFGVTFACFLIAEQSATFCGLMLRTNSQIRDTHGADIWVMSTGVRYIDDLKPISD